MAITNSNVQNVKFLRNNALYATRDAARTALETNKGEGFDGTLLLARYSGETATDVKTLGGLIWSDGTNSTVTIIDVEGASADVEKLRQEINAKLGTGVSSANTVTAQLTALSGNSSTDTSATTSVEGAKKYANDLISTLDGGITAETGSYIQSVSEVDGKISGTTAELPTVGVITVEGKPIIAVNETKGIISASAGTINAEYVNVTGAVFTSTTVQGALEEINSEYKAAISDLDYTDTAVTGSYVSKVDEVDGVISVSREALPSVTDTAVNMKFVTAVAEDKGQITVSRGEITSSNKTISLSANTDGGIDFKANVDGSTIIIDENTGTMSVASSALIQYVGDEDTIRISDVVGDSKTVSSLLSIKEVSTGVPDTVAHRYMLAGTGTTNIGEYIDIPKDSALVNFYLGHVDDKLTDVDPTTQESPTSAVTNGSGDAALVWIMQLANGNYKLTAVNVEAFLEESEFASGVTADSATHIVHGVVDPTSETFLTVGASGFKLSGVQDAINSAVNALDATVSGETSDGKVNVKVTEANGVITAVDVIGTDIASASALTAETAARKAIDGQNGDTYAANTSANYISGATSLNDADVNLDTALKAEETRAIAAEKEAKTEIVYNNTASSDSTKGLVITKTDDGTDNHDIYTIQFGILDCGFYS